VFFIYSTHGVGGEEKQLNPKYYAAARQLKERWEIPEASHTGGIEARPNEHERRVVGFLDRAPRPGFAMNAAVWARLAERVDLTRIAAEARDPSSTDAGLSASGGPTRWVPPPVEELGAGVYATLRCYEGIDMVRSEEITRKVHDRLLPALQELPGFNGYFLIDVGRGVLTSVGLFETSAQAEESTRVAAQWVRDAKLESALPQPPTITSGPVIAEGARALANANGGRTGS
jgi:hypothetical protein